jgi:hypothetical protein
MTTLLKYFFLYVNNKLILNFDFSNNYNELQKIIISNNIQSTLSGTKITKIPSIEVHKKITNYNVIEKFSILHNGSFIDFSSKIDKD